MVCLGESNTMTMICIDLTDYRPELAGSPEKFFRVLDKIKDPENQEFAVRLGVRILFEAGKHDLVVPLVNALGKRTFNGESLKDVAIQMAFHEGADRGNQDIVDYIANILRSPLGICSWIVCVLEQWQTKSSLSVSIGAS